MMTNYTNKVLYTGVTNDLERRVREHKSGLIPGFTQKYRCKKLVYFESFSDIEQAIRREKLIKEYSRDKKNQLVNNVNPEWKDLSDGWI
jgi:putative endonuclease